MLNNLLKKLVCKTLTFFSEPDIAWSNAQLLLQLRTTHFLGLNYFCTELVNFILHGQWPLQK